MTYIRERLWGVLQTAVLPKYPERAQPSHHINPFVAWYKIYLISLTLKASW